MQTKQIKIGKVTTINNVFLAPMAGITDIPMRSIIKSMGAGLLYSEMISAEGLIRNGKKTLKITEILDEERPVALQIFGSNPMSMSKASEILSKTADILDINCGCSVRKVLKSGSGAALLKEIKKFETIVTAVIKSSKVPVTVKIRSGWDPTCINAVETAKAAEACGVSAIAVHPRTKSQAFSGTADWEIIGEVKKAVKIPVIGNGDIKNEFDAERMLKDTGCDAIMIRKAVWAIHGFLKK